MAEGKKINRKWIIALAILVLIAVAVVLVVVLIPKSIKDVVNKAQTQAEQMFLVDEDEQNMFKNDFQKKINTNAAAYKVEVQNAVIVLELLPTVLDFYNDYLVFAQDNKTFQNNYNVIMDGFSDANTYQKTMKSIVKEVYEKVSASSTFTEGAWLDFKEVFVKYVKSYNNSFKGLCKVFNSCVPNGVVNNEYTVKVLSTLNDYLEVICKDFDKSTAKVVYLQKFVEDKLDSQILASYKFSNAMQASFELISKFESTYGMTIQKFIEKNFEVGPVSADEGGLILLETREYLTGGLSA